MPAVTGLVVLTVFFFGANFFAAFTRVGLEMTKNRLKSTNKKIISFFMIYSIVAVSI